MLLILKSGTAKEVYGDIEKLAKSLYDHSLGVLRVSFTVYSP